MPRRRRHRTLVDTRLPIDIVRPVTGPPPPGVVVDRYIDRNGCPTEIRVMPGIGEITIHYDDIPETDMTVVNGLPCTTPLRTVIDLAPEVERDHLRRIVADCLTRGLFTKAEAAARVNEPDMVARPGAKLLLEILVE